MTVRAFGPVSSTTGAAIDLDFSTMSIGFSKIVSMALMGLIVDASPSAVRGRSFKDSVMSARGVWISDGSGDCEGFGVGSGGGRSGVADFRGRRTRDGALFILRGDPRLVGDSGSMIVLSSAGSRISDGSISPVSRLFFPRPVVRGVAATEVVVFLLPAGALRGLRLGAGAGVKSSSSSRSILEVIISSSSSSDSMTNFFRAAAALREGRTGDSDIIGVWRGQREESAEKTRRLILELSRNQSQKYEYKS